MNAPFNNPIDVKTQIQIDTKDLINKQLKISESQSITSNIQYKISIVLSVGAIIVGLIPLFQSNDNNDINVLIKQQVKQSEELKRMSFYLHDLQNHVKTKVLKTDTILILKN
jgi:pseudouridine-5'-phosphate glycosidase